MKSIGKILLFGFFIFSMFMLKPRQDVVFEAIDMSQYIKLFQENRDFILCLDENSIFTGTYAIQADTVFLSYTEQGETAMAPRSLQGSVWKQSLPGKLFIDENNSTIESADGQLFTADIFLDLRNKPYEAMAYSPGRIPKQRAKILAFGGLK